MTPSVETLASLLEKFPVAMMTRVDGAARPRTRALRTVRSAFSGHVWLRGSDDPAALIDIGRGSEVSLAFGSAAEDQYVAIHGWAIVLRNSPYSRSLLGNQSYSTRGPLQSCAALICVTARAAEMWDATSGINPRVFAFAHAQPIDADDPAESLGAVSRIGGRTHAAVRDVSW